MNSRMIRTLTAAALALAAAGCTVAVDEQRVLHPRRTGGEAVAALKAGGVYAVEEFTIAAPDGAKLGGLFLRGRGGADHRLWGGNLFEIDRHAAGPPPSSRR